MARARIKNTGTPRNGRLSRCDKCGKDILPGTQRFEWSFRYGGTYHRHQACGMPRQSETTQGNVSQLYAAQESIEDALASPEPDTVEAFDDWKEAVAAALDEANNIASELQGEYETAAEPFGGAGANQERAEQCESWAEQLDDAASTVRGIEVEQDEDSDPDAISDLLAEAIQEVRDAAEEGSGALEL